MIVFLSYIWSKVPSRSRALSPSLRRTSYGSSSSRLVTKNFLWWSSSFHPLYRMNFPGLDFYRTHGDWFIRNDATTCRGFVPRFRWPRSSPCYDCLLFNDGHVLQLWSETVAIHRRMIYVLDDIWWSYGNRGRMWLKFPDICLTVKAKPRNKPQPEIDPTGDRTRTRCVRSKDVIPRPQRWSGLALADSLCIWSFPDNLIYRV